MSLRKSAPLYATIRSPMNRHVPASKLFYLRMLQVVDNAVFWQNILLYFENVDDPLSPSF